MTQYSTGSMSGAGVGDAGPLTMIGGAAFIGNVIGLFAFTWVALLVFGYIALLIVLSVQASRAAKNASAAESGSVVLMLSCLAALVGGVLVGAFHWVQYQHAAYVVLGLYAVAVVVWLAGRAFTAGWSCLFPALGLAMLLAARLLGSPPGADDMEQAENWTPVTVTVVDEEGNPIEGATVYLDLVWFWQGDPELEGDDREWWSEGTTAGDGTARMALHEDPRFKQLVIRVRRDPLSNGYNEPKTIGDWVGYDDVRLAANALTPKKPHSIHVVMSRREHPDAGFLAIELTEPQAAEGVVSRSIRLALSTEAEPPAEEYPGQLDQITAGNLCVRHCYLSGTEPLVFRLGRELAGQPLTLHVMERDYSDSSETYRQLQSVSIEPTHLGEEHTLGTLALPRRTLHTAAAP
jgi:hypothetical protein